MFSLVTASCVVAGISPPPLFCFLSFPVPPPPPGGTPVCPHQTTPPRPPRWWCGVWAQVLHRRGRAGAQVVVDVSNAPNWGDAAVMDFFQTSARNILAAETAGGIGHHVALSVVGTDRLQGSGYFRAKLAQEEAIKAAAIPSTILRATPLLEVIGRIADSSTQDETRTLAPLQFHPEAAPP